MEVIGEGPPGFSGGGALAGRLIHPLCSKNSNNLAVLLTSVCMINKMKQKHIIYNVIMSNTKCNISNIKY